MKIRTFLLLAAIILVVIIVSGKTALYYYWAALVATVSYLNSRRAFLKERYKRYNVLFFIYLLFVVWERTRWYQLPAAIELTINNAEHILFGIMICFIASLVLKLPPFNIRSFFIRLLLSVLIFNGIGFINEYFQNWLYSRPVFTLIPDSLKDLRMNVWGTMIFVGVSIATYYSNKKKTSLQLRTG